MLRFYYPLTKPGIVFGNIVTTAAGFCFAARGEINGALFCYTLIGLLSVIASSCVYNNLIDQAADAKMERTKNRALVTGEVSSQGAFIFATSMGLLGFATLIIYTNYLTTAIAGIGFIIYVLVYTFIKYKTSHATLIGSIAGAMPPVAGYCAVTNEIDMRAFLLFLLLVLWQMPHFFAIALYKLEEYRAADIPVLPLEKGIDRTKNEMLLYTVLFVVVSVFLPYLGYTGKSYLFFALVTGSIWIKIVMNGFYTTENEVWAKRVFLFSLVVINTFSFILSMDYR